MSCQGEVESREFLGRESGRHTYNDDGFGFWMTFLPTSTSPLETPWDLSHTPLTRQHNLYRGYCTRLLQPDYSGYAN